VVIIGGGNLLFNRSGTDFLAYCRAFARKGGAKIIFLGVGVGPFSFPYKAALKEIVDCSRFCLARDEDSVKILKSCNPRSSKIGLIQDSGLYVSRAFPLPASEKSQFGINLMSLTLVPSEFGKAHQNIEKIIKNIIFISNKTGLQPKIIHSSTHADHNIMDELARGLQVAGHSYDVAYLSDGKSLSEIYARLGFMVSFRMHPSLFAFSYNIPTVVFPWQRKIKSIYNDLLGSLSASYFLESAEVDTDEVLIAIRRQQDIPAKYIIEAVLNRLEIRYCELYRKIYDV
jgi:polysaccharide pyruvyl transferase WcaK-like protein